MIATNATPPAAHANANDATYSHHVIDEPTNTATHARQHAPANGATRLADASHGFRSKITHRPSTRRTTGQPIAADE